MSRPKTSLLIFYSFVMLLCITNCTHLRDESTDVTSKMLPNGKHLVVEKINKETTAIGLITKYNYGTTHSFSYKIDLDNGSIKWNGGSAEPKHLLFCNDTIYIHYFRNKWIEEQGTDSLSTTTNGHYQIHEDYQAFIDKRYFFNLFGDAYWVETTPNNYRKQKAIGNEFEVPNDNELVLD